MDMDIIKASPSMIENIVDLDENVIGSRKREEIIRCAVDCGQCYVTIEGNKIAAYGIMDYHFFEQGFISLLIVGHTYRRKGYGSKMIKRFVEVCETDKLFTSTNSSNFPMHKLMENCGFRQCGYISELDEGDPEIVYCYKKSGIVNGKR